MVFSPYSGTAVPSPPSPFEESLPWPPSQSPGFFRAPVWGSGFVSLTWFSPAFSVRAETPQGQGHCLGTAPRSLGSYSLITLTNPPEESSVHRPASLSSGCLATLRGLRRRVP